MKGGTTWLANSGTEHISGAAVPGYYSRMKTAPADDLDTRIENLWDTLSEFDAASHDQALEQLLNSLCNLTDSHNAVWLAAVRLPDIAPGDPIHGWRPRMVRFLHPAKALDESVKEQTAKIEKAEIDATIISNISLAGKLRANRLSDLVPPEWFASEYYRVFYLGFDNADAIWTGCPVNEDAEVYFGLFRDPRQPRFTRADCDATLAALRGLKWFHRQYLLSHGLLVASAPLTPTEREVLKGVLSGQTEKEIAKAQERALHTLHEHMKSLYRKFGVKNRAALMALWLGKAT